MTTELRLTTILFLSILLTGFLVIPVMTILNMDLDNLSSEPISRFVIFTISSILVLGGLLAVRHFTLKIHIDFNHKKIKFLYPFKLQSQEYEFGQLQGFRFKYLPAKIDYKAIQFKTSDNKIYTVSDFETANLRQLEKTCVDYFDLRGENFKGLNEKEKEIEIEISRQFDISQAKDKRFGLIFLISVFCFILFMIIKQGLEGNGTISLARGLIILTFIIIIIGLVRSLIKNESVIKNGAQHRV